MSRPSRTEVFTLRTRRLVAGLVTLALAVGMDLATAPGAGAVGVLDQSQTTVGSPTEDWISIPGPTSGSPVTAAQTFTAGASGLLDQVDMHLGTVGDAFDGLVVEIRNVVGGEPGSTVLATSTFTAPDGTLSPDWRSVTFNPPAMITATTQYAIVAYPAAGSSEYRWSTSGTDSYASGEVLYSDTIPATTWSGASSLGDAAFKTYVSPGGADLSVTLDPPTTAKSKSTMTYTITIDNAGPETAENVVVTAPLPYGVEYLAITTSAGTCTTPGRRVQRITCTVGDIASGDDSTHEVTLKVTARAGKGHLNHIVTVDSDTDDPDPDNNTATASTAVTR